MEQKILALFQHYLGCARQIAEELRASLGVSNLLTAVNSGQIPRRGACSSFGGGEYYIHGAGCRIQAAEIEIDFDFGPEETLPGADPWKLFNFADAHAEAYGWLPSRESFNQCIQKLIDRDVLYRLGLPPSPHLVMPRRQP